MLLSHNFDISPDVLPALSREAFAEVFRLGLNAYETIHCRTIDHPHWMAEILFPTPEFSPLQVGELCAQALAQQRSPHLTSNTEVEILVLGGLKSTPPTSDAPDALQPGEWGVDVVETHSGEVFLQAIAWETTIDQKPADSIFKVQRQVI
jgi:Protein of unknown function (DUF2656)